MDSDSDYGLDDLTDIPLEHIDALEKAAFAAFAQASGQSFPTSLDQPLVHDQSLVQTSSQLAPHSSSQSFFQSNFTESSHSKPSSTPSSDTEYDDFGIELDLTEEEWRKLDSCITAKYGQKGDAGVKEDINREKFEQEEEEVGGKEDADGGRQGQPDRQTDIVEREEVGGEPLGSGRNSTGEKGDRSIEGNRIGGSDASEEEDVSEEEEDLSEEEENTSEQDTSEEDTTAEEEKTAEEEDEAEWKGIIENECVSEEESAASASAPIQDVDPSVLEVYFTESKLPSPPCTQKPRIITHYCPSTYSRYDERMLPKDLFERLIKKRRIESGLKVEKVGLPSDPPLTAKETPRPAAREDPLDDEEHSQVLKIFDNEALPSPLVIIPPSRTPDSIPAPSLKRKRSEFEKEHATPIQAFFAQYNTFKYNPNGETMKQFSKLCKHMRWDKEPKLSKRPKVRSKRSMALRSLQDAIAEQFNRCYGVNDKSLVSWQGLFEVCGVSPLPGTVKECKEAVKFVHANIWDLVDYSITGTPPKLFPSEATLASYSRDNDKIYPRNNVKAGSLLKFLLRHILSHPRRRKTAGSKS